jgi:hypothetical protein
MESGCDMMSLRSALAMTRSSPDPIMNILRATCAARTRRSSGCEAAFALAQTALSPVCIFDLPNKNLETAKGRTVRSRPEERGGL